MNRRQLLGEIKPSMKLTTGFFLKVYGYDLTWPGFAENVLSRMEILGCSKARDYYTAVVAEYEHNHEKELKAAAEWYKKRCEEDYERREREAVKIAWIQREAEPQKKQERSLELKGSLPGSATLITGRMPFLRK